MARYAASLATADLWSALATDVRQTSDGQLLLLACPADRQTHRDRQIHIDRLTEREREREREKVPGRDYGGK